MNVIFVAHATYIADFLQVTELAKVVVCSRTMHKQLAGLARRRRPYEFVYCASYGGFERSAEAWSTYCTLFPVNKEDDYEDGYRARLVPFVKYAGEAANTRHCKFAFGAIPWDLRDGLDITEYDGLESYCFSECEWLAVQVHKFAKVPAATLEEEASRYRHLMNIPTNGETKHMRAHARHLNKTYLSKRKYPINSNC